MVGQDKGEVKVPQELLEAAALTKLCSALKKNSYDFNSFAISDYRKVLEEGFGSRFNLMDGTTMKQEIKELLAASADPIHQESAEKIQ